MKLSHLKLFLFVLGMLSLFGCERENDDLVCGVDDPLTELDWLHEIKTGFEMRMSIAGAQIIQYTYEEEYVFWIEDPCCNSENPRACVYNCVGEIVCDLREEMKDCIDFKELATDSTMLFNNIQ